MGNCLDGFWIEIERRETVPKCCVCEESAIRAWGEMTPNEQHQWTWKNLTAYHTVCLVDEKIKSQQKEEFLEYLKKLKSIKFPRSRWVPQLKKISSGTEWANSVSFLESDLLIQAALNEVANSDGQKYTDISNITTKQSQNGQITHEHHAQNGQLKECEIKLHRKSHGKTQVVQIIEEESEGSSESLPSVEAAPADTPPTPPNTLDQSKTQLNVI